MSNAPAGFSVVSFGAVAFLYMSSSSSGISETSFAALLVGLVVLVLLFLRATGVELAPSFPMGLVIAGMGGLGTIFVLIRLIDVPDTWGPAGRGIGVWISLVAGFALIVAGVLKAGEEL